MTGKPLRAEQAGVKVGDIVLSLDGYRTDWQTSVQVLAEAGLSGRQVEMLILRGASAASQYIGGQAGSAKEGQLVDDQAIRQIVTQRHQQRQGVPAPPTGPPPAVSLEGGSTGGSYVEVSMSLVFDCLYSDTVVPARTELESVPCISGD